MGIKLAEKCYKALPGFSFDVNGNPPTEGYMIALVTRTYEKLTQQDIEEFLNEHEVGKDFIGHWLHEGIDYLGISQNRLDLEHSIIIGILREQHSIWDVQAGKEIVLPKGQTHGTLSQAKAYARMKAREMV
jgi:hypothetical protein